MSADRDDDEGDEEQSEKKRFGIFFGISFAGWLVDTALLNVLITAGGLGGSIFSPLAKAISVTIASFSMFLMHRRWTYRDRKGPFLGELGRYALVRGSTIALSIGLFSLAHYLLHGWLSRWLSEGATDVASANLAQIVTSMIVLGVSWVAHGHFTFRRTFAYDDD